MKIIRSDKCDISIPAAST